MQPIQPCKTEADRLVYLCHKLGLTAIQFAENYGLSKSQVSHFMHGRRRLSREALEKLAQQDIDINWLLTGKSARQEAE
ncbi:MAG: helix-turn-helix domain-containing protein [Treponema sp.]|jgi:transcriptional regulator with XRE-family HTH domain|nr:helix-turn-helix domain-containing protein [Treponema sp.]